MHRLMAVNIHLRKDSGAVGGSTAKMTSAGGELNNKESFFCRRYSLKVRHGVQIL